MTVDSLPVGERTLNVSDPEDLPGPDGDPSLDIKSVDVRIEATTVTTEIFFYGTWPPATTHYSWLVDLVYKADTTFAFTVTPQLDNGTRSTISNLPESAYTITDGADSVKIVVTGVTQPLTHLLLQSAIKKTSAGNLVWDKIPDTAIPD